MTWTDAEAARNFVTGVKLGVQDWAEVAGHETIYGASDGFVYFVAIGAPYVTHVKIGYTRSDPAKRMGSLQTGCPFPMKLLGYVFGTEAREQELHQVLRDYRCSGEWFEYSEYVQLIIGHQLQAEAI